MPTCLYGLPLIILSRILMAIDFITGASITLIPILKRKCVIAVYNARFHKGKRNQSFLTGMTIIFYGYNPNLNPEVEVLI